MWPVVNGRCLTSGLDLRSMDASDALDLLYYFFELDAVDQVETLKARSHVREQLWPLWFDEPYKYPRASEDDNPRATTTYGSYQDTMDLPEDFPAQDERPVKPFVPASTPEELAEVLDGPLGG